MHAPFEARKACRRLAPFPATTTVVVVLSRWRCPAPELAVQFAPVGQAIARRDHLYEL